MPSPLRQAKKTGQGTFKVEGWTVPAGDVDITQQVTKKSAYSSELITDEDGETSQNDT